MDQQTFCGRSQLIGAWDSQYYISNIMFLYLGSPNKGVFSITIEST